jgi:LruC domain-containing protein
MSRSRLAPWLVATASLCLAHAPSRVHAQSCTADLDTDGVPDFADAFPDDSRASGAVFVPARGQFHQLMFEDRWPRLGDADFNDVVLAYNTVLRTTTQGVQHITLTLHPLALGGALTNGLGLHIPVPRQAVSSVTVKVGANGAATRLQPSADAQLTVLVLDSLRESFAGRAGQINSAPGAYVAGEPIQVDVTLTQSLPAAALTAAAPFDVFITRQGEPGHEIHGSAYAGSAAMNTALFNTESDASSASRHFVDTKGLPFMLDVPTVGRWPAEATDIASLFPRIQLFASSAGAEGLDYATSGVELSAAYTPSNGAAITPAFLPGYDVGYVEPSGTCVPDCPYGLRVDNTCAPAAGRVSAGQYRTCAVRPDGSVACWGRNNQGQLGNGSLVDVTAPTTVTSVANAVSVSAGDSHSCALLTDGTARCWGNNTFGQLGNGTTTSATSAVQVSGLTDATAIAAGANHSCALRRDGSTWCWGYNGMGQLGIGTVANAVVPTQVTSLSNTAALSAGTLHTCALARDGSVRCWGGNNAGQRGTGNTTQTTTPALVSLPSATAISAGDSHTCAVLTTGSLRCWGFNNMGQLGNGTTVSATSPTAVAGLSNVTAVDAGYLITCALLADGTTRCWGNNASGQLGSGALGSASAPVQNGLTQVVAVSAGDFHTCALHTDGQLSCAGLNTYGQLGNGKNSVVSSSAPVSNLAGVASVAVGSSHTCAQQTTGVVQCWGHNASGQATGGASSGFFYAPLPTIIPLATNPNLTALASGQNHTCAVEAGVLSCWGSNSVGQLGNGTNTTPTAPVTPALGPVRAVTGGGAHTCAVTVDGRAWCWGYNSSGQLGTGNTTNFTVPFPLNAMNGLSSIAAGESYTCGILGGQVYCWGLNSNGQLGDGTRTTRTSPTLVAGLAPVSAVAPGGSHTCALKTDGTVWCWGLNTAGQLGNLQPPLALTPIQVAGLSGVTALAAGASHSCAVLGNGTARCWGNDADRQLGTGAASAASSSVPVAVAGLSGVTSISAGYAHTCARLSDGTVRCWGSDATGQIGANGYGFAFTPVAVIWP